MVKVNFGIMKEEELDLKRMCKGRFIFIAIFVLLGLMLINGNWCVAEAAAKATWSEMMVAAKKSIMTEAGGPKRADVVDAFFEIKKGYET